jgi:hypothetical protein
LILGVYCCCWQFWAACEVLAMSSISPRTVGTPPWVLRER